jgi:hypothetical protein
MTDPFCLSRNSVFFVISIPVLAVLRLQGQCRTIKYRRKRFIPERAGCTSDRSIFYSCTQPTAVLEIANNAHAHTVDYAEGCVQRKVSCEKGEIRRVAYRFVVTFVRDLPAVMSLELL